MFTTPSTIYRGITSENDDERFKAREEFGRIYAPYLYTWAMSKTSDIQLAEDLQQEVLVAFLKTVESRGLRPRVRPGQLRCFLKIIAKRTWNLLLRKGSRSKLKLVENPEDFQVALDDATDFYMEQLRREELIEEALKKLKVSQPRDCGVFRAKYFENRSVKEIAKMYSLEPQSVYKIIAKVKLMIKEYGEKELLNDV